MEIRLIAFTPAGGFEWKWPSWVSDPAMGKSLCGDKRRVAYDPIPLLRKATMPVTDRDLAELCLRIYPGHPPPTWDHLDDGSSPDGVCWGVSNTLRMFQ